MESSRFWLTFQVVFNPGGVNNNEEKPKGESAEIQSGVIFSD